MSKVLNLKIIFIIIIAVIISVFAFIKLNIKTVETTQDFVETTTNLIGNFNKSETKTKTEVHGNSDKNKKLHIVYEIYAVDNWNVEFTLKYGISGQKNYVRKEGNPRPQSQLKKIAKNTQYEKYKITYRILYDNIEGRIKAKVIEKKLVTEYFYSNSEQMPPFQRLPLPDDLFNF